MTTLTETAAHFNLRPQREPSGRVRFVCAHCGDASAPKPKRTAHGWDNAPCTWWCYRCNAKGFYFDIYKAFGAEAPREDEQPAFVPVKVRAPIQAHINVASGWKKLLEQQETSDYIYNYLTFGRGFPDALAKTLCEMSDDIAWAFGDSALAKRANAVNRHIAIALRDASGKVVNISRRWGLPGNPTDNMPKAMVLNSKDTGGPSAYFGGIMAFGNIPEALDTARSAPLYIVEGGPDYLVLQSMILSGHLNGAVIGAYNVTSMQALTKHLLHELNNSAAVLPRIVFVPHVNDTPLPNDTIGVGERSALTCAQMLTGRAGVYCAHIPAPKGVEGDLNDLLRHRGIAEVIACLTSAEMLSAAPIEIGASLPVIRAKMASAVIKAAASGGVVVYQVDAGAGKSYAALGLSSDVALGALAINPNGKADTKLRSVVFATPSNALAEEKYKAFSLLYPSTPARMAYGAMHYCAYRDKVETEFAVLGRRGVCGDPNNAASLCDLYTTCLGAQVPEPARGEVMFTSHAMALNIKADLVIIDEDCGVIDTTQTSQASIVSLFTSTSTQKRVKKWIGSQNPDAVAGAFYLNQMATNALTYAFKAQGSLKYDIRVNGDNLLTLMQTNLAELGAFMQGYDESALPPPRPWPKQVRNGWNLSKYMPSQKAYATLVAMRASLAECMKPAAEQNLFIKNNVSLVLGSRFTWHIEVKELSGLPDAPAIVLDATGQYVMAEWRAAITDRSVDFESTIVQGAAPASALHIDCKGFSKSLCVADGQVDRFCADRAESVLARLAAEVRAKGCRSLDEEVTLAFLTHRPVYDALAGIATYPNAVSVKERMDKLCSEMRIKLMLGYYGRHDRGTNEFEMVDGLVVSGDPRGNLGDAQQDAALIGVSLDDSYSGRTMATAVQAINRARHLRRSAGNRVVLMYVGEMPPTLRGFDWVVEELTRKAYARHSDDLINLGRYIAQHDGVLSAYSLAHWDCAQHPNAPQVDVKVAHAQKIARAVAFCVAELGWSETQVRLVNGRMARVAAPEASFAQRWAQAGCPVGVPYEA